MGLKALVCAEHPATKGGTFGEGFIQGILSALPVAAAELGGAKGPVKGGAYLTTGYLIADYVTEVLTGDRLSEHIVSAVPGYCDDYVGEGEPG